MKYVFTGGGVAEEGEFIEILEMCIPEAKTFLNEESVNASIECIWGLQWFFGHKSIHV